ncbi:hypothetical protein HK104_007242, partial [Borealophlyctis nickersoniae]
LRTSLPALLRLIPPRAIFIADNGSSASEVALTHSIAAALTSEYRKKNPRYRGAGINVGVLKEGSKNLAQFSVLHSLAYLGSEVEFVSLLDDDTMLPDDWSEDHIISLFDTSPPTQCLAYPLISTQNTSGPFLSQFQNYEYRLAMFLKIAQSRIATALFPSGAVSTWRAPMLLEVLSRHDTMFRGDDLQMGLILHTMEGRGSYLNPYEVHRGDYKIRVAPYCVETVVPRCTLHVRDLFPKSM